MNAEEFSHLSLENRLKLVTEEGNEVFSKHKNDMVFKVFEVHGFFVEVIYDVHADKLKSVELIGQTELLKKYDDLIDLSELGF